MNGFFSSQSSYRPLAWIFHGRELNHKINMVYERYLRVVYHDTTSLFEESLQKENSVLRHHRNIQVLSSEIFRVCKGTSPKIMKEVFPRSQPLNYNIRNQLDFSTRTVESVYYGYRIIRISWT